MNDNSRDENYHILWITLDLLITESELASVVSKPLEILKFNMALTSTSACPCHGNNEMLLTFELHGAKDFGKFSSLASTKLWLHIRICSVPTKHMCNFNIKIYICLADSISIYSLTSSEIKCFVIHYCSFNMGIYGNGFHFTVIK
jgi:hypothetical protein